MTTCELIMKPITRMVEKEHKNLDEIAGSVCPKVEYGREKIIRVIKDFLGEDYLVKHADILKYDIKMAEMAKKRKSHEKIDAKADIEKVKKSLTEMPEKACASPSSDDDLVNMIRLLVEKYGYYKVMNAIDEIGCKA